MVISRFAVGAFLLATVVGSADVATAQPDNFQVMPESIDFGRVERGAKIVSTAQAFLGSGSAQGQRFSVDPPSFVAVRSAGVGSFGPEAKSTVRFSLEFSVNTANVGVQEGNIGVIFDHASIQLPLRIEVVEPQEDSISVLLLDDPFRNGATPVAIEAWHRLVDRAKLSPHYVKPLRGPVLNGIDLALYRSVLINNTAVVNLSEREVEHLDRFVRDGGRLILFVGPESPGNRFPMHDLVESLGMKALQEQRVGPKVFSFAADGLPDEPLFAGISELRFEGHYPISVTDADRARVLLSYPDRPDAAVIAHAKLGKGDAIAIAQHHWPIWFGEGPDRRFVGADNAAFLENLLALRDRPE